MSCASKRTGGLRERTCNGLVLSSQTEDAPSVFGTCEEGHGGGSDAGDQRGEEDGHLEGEDTAVA